MSAKTSAAVPSSTSTALTKAQAFLLADLWVSEHNRVPFQWSSDDAVAPEAPPRSGWRVEDLFNFWPFNVVIASPLTPRFDLLNLMFRGVAWARRRARQGQVAAELAVPDDVMRTLRRAFADAIADPRVRTMTDKAQRTYLGEVLWCALRGEAPPPP